MEPKWTQVARKWFQFGVPNRSPKLEPKAVPKCTNWFRFREPIWFPKTEPKTDQKPEPGCNLYMILHTLSSFDAPSLWAAGASILVPKNGTILWSGGIDFGSKKRNRFGPRNWNQNHNKETNILDPKGHGFRTAWALDWDHCVSLSYQRFCQLREPIWLQRSSHIWQFPVDPVLDSSSGGQVLSHNSARDTSARNVRRARRPPQRSLHLRRLILAIDSALPPTAAGKILSGGLLRCCSRR